MVFKSFIGATCACLAVVSFNANAALVTYDLRFFDISTGGANVDKSGRITIEDDTGNAEGRLSGEARGLQVLLSTESFYDVTNLAENLSPVFFIRSTTEGNPLAGYVHHDHVFYPSAVWLFGSGLIGLIGLARRKENA